MEHSVRLAFVPDVPPKWTMDWEVLLNGNTGRAAGCVRMAPGSQLEELDQLEAQTHWCYDSM